MIEISQKTEVAHLGDGHRVRCGMAGGEEGKLDWSQELKEFQLHCEIETGILKDFAVWWGEGKCYSACGSANNWEEGAQGRKGRGWLRQVGKGGAGWCRWGGEASRCLVNGRGRVRPHRLPCPTLGGALPFVLRVRASQYWLLLCLQTLFQTLNQEVEENFRVVSPFFLNLFLNIPLSLGRKEAWRRRHFVLWLLLQRNLHIETKCLRF